MHPNQKLLEGRGTPCAPGEVAHSIDHHSDGAYAVLRFSLRCPEEIATLHLRYNLLFDLDPQHSGLLRLSHNGETASAIFSPEKAEQKFTVAERSSLRQFLDYCREGIWHIWIGFDHILFLIPPLLPAVLVLKIRTLGGDCEF